MVLALGLLAVLWILLACGCGWLGFHLAKQYGSLLLRIDALEGVLKDMKASQGAPSPGLPPGTVLTDFTLPLLSGGSMTLSQWRGRALILIFFNPTCHFCRDMLPELSAVLPADLTTADPVPLIISTGTTEENRRIFDGHRISCPVLVQEKFEVAGPYRANATPLAYVVDAAGATIGNAQLGAEPILAMFPPAAAKPGDPPVARGLARSKLKRDGLKAGTVAPEFRLPALDGSEIALSDYRGRQVLLVFSDPDCGPCNQLVPDLEKLHRASNDLQVLMVSRGDPEANRKKVREFGITFPIVLQQQWEISRTYGMFATPIGFLVGESGVLVSDAAVGSEEIRGLAAQRQTKGGRAELLSLASIDH